MLLTTRIFASPDAVDEAVFGPMRAEMDRSLARLREGSFGSPYFIAYRVVDESSFGAEASFGSLLENVGQTRRVLFAELRYGGPRLDNTDLNFRGWYAFASQNPEALRQDLWLLTDAAYKNAVSSFLEKKARRATEFEPEPLSDFTVEPATAAAVGQPGPYFARERAVSLAERLSAVFRDHPDVYEGRVSVRLGWARRRLLTSEGTRVSSPQRNLSSYVTARAMTRAPDGMRLDDSFTRPVVGLSDGSMDAALERETRRLASELEAMRSAPVQPPAEAPAILDPELTGVLFHEALGHKLEGERQRDPEQGQLFKGMVGKRIIPEFLSLIDDPTMESFRGEPLHGHYDVDDEGAPARRVVLVDHGILTNFLMSRWPVKGFDRSNGHGRSDAYLRPTGRMSNLIVRAEAPVPREKLWEMFLALLRKTNRSYGFWLVGSFGGDNQVSRGAAQTLEVRPRLIYRVDARTGKKTLVRGVRLVGTPLVMLNRIAAAGDDETLGNGYFCGAESGDVPVDQIAPSVLVSTIELQRLPEDRVRPPLLPSPFHDRRTP